MKFRNIIQNHKKLIKSTITEIRGNFDVLIEQKNTTESSRLFGCDKIKYYANHIMIYRRGRLIFKIWLRKEDYKDLEDAMKDVGIRLYQFPK